MSCQVRLDDTSEMPDATEAYVARLVARLTAKGKPIPLAQIGSGTPKPSSITGGLKAFLRGRPEFVLIDPQQGGGGEKVSLSTATELDDVLVCDLPRDHRELQALIGEAIAIRDQLGKKQKQLRKTLNLMVHVRDADPHKVEHNQFVTSTLAEIRAALVDAKKVCPPTSAEQAHLARGEAAVLRGQLPRKVGNVAGNIDRALRADHALARHELHAVVHAGRDGFAAGSSATPITPEARQALEAELRKINVSRESYVEPELRECDARGFVAAEVLLWIASDDGRILILMANEKPPLLTFLGGKRDSLGETARQTAERKATEGTGGLLSRATRAAILAGSGPVLWDSKGKYATFVVEAVAEDAHLPRRLEERGALKLMEVSWNLLSDVLSWHERSMLEMSAEHPLHLLQPHLSALQRSKPPPHLGRSNAKASNHAEKSLRSDPAEPLRASVSTAKEMAPFIASARTELSSNALQPVLLKVFTDKERLAPWGLTQIHVPCRVVLATNVHMSHVAVRADPNLDSKPLIVRPGETVQVGWAKRDDRVIGQHEDLSPVIDEGTWELFPRSPLSSSAPRRGQDVVEMRLFAIPLVDVHHESGALVALHDPRAVHLEHWRLRLKPYPRPKKAGDPVLSPTTGQPVGGYWMAPPLFPIYSSEVEITRVGQAKLCSTSEQAVLERQSWEQSPPPPQPKPPQPKPPQPQHPPPQQPQPQQLPPPSQDGCVIL